MAWGKESGCSAQMIQADEGAMRIQKAGCPCQSHRRIISMRGRRLESLVLRKVGGRSLPKRGFHKKMMVTERQAPETGHRASRPFSLSAWD